MSEDRDGGPAVAGRLASRGAGAQRGASTLAAAIGIFALGVIIALAVPLVMASVRKARATAAAGQLRALAQVFESHAREHGGWPAATQAPGEIPAGMDRNKLGAAWSRPSPLGFKYLWAPDSLQRGRRYRALLVLWREHPTSDSDERRLFEAIDRQVDDGDLLSGKFRLGYRDDPFFVLEE